MEHHDNSAPNSIHTPPSQPSISLRPQPRFSDALKTMLFAGRKPYRPLPKIKIPGYGDNDDHADDYFDRIMRDASDAWWEAKCLGDEYTPPWIRLPDELNEK